MRLYLLLTTESVNRPFSTTRVFFWHKSHIVPHVTPFFGLDARSSPLRIGLCDNLMADTLAADPARVDALLQEYLPAGGELSPAALAAASDALARRTDMVGLSRI